MNSTEQTTVAESREIILSDVFTPAQCQKFQQIIARWHKDPARLLLWLKVYCRSIAADCEKAGFSPYDVAYQVYAQTLNL